MCSKENKMEKNCGEKEKSAFKREHGFLRSGNSLISLLYYSTFLVLLLCIPLMSEIIQSLSFLWLVSFIPSYFLTLDPWPCLSLCDFIVVWQYLVMFRDYSWFCTQGSFLEAFNGPNVVPGNKPRIIMCKAITLHAIFSLSPKLFF